MISPPDTAPDAGAGLDSRPSVLVVDDTRANLDLLSSLLKERGYRVRPVPRGRLALAAARKDPPDIVLLDVRMPEMDGYEVCEQMAADSLLSDIPVIFVSAMDETVDKLRAFAAGGVDFLSKPFDIEEVDARLRTHLELRRQKLALQDSYERLQGLEYLRDRLVHMIVHDLRNPLQAMCASIDTLREVEGSGMTPLGLRSLDTAHSSGQVLLEMISSLLDIHRLECGAMPMHLEEGDLGELVREGVQLVSGLQGGRTLRLELPQLPAPVMADRMLMRRVVQNLLSNAFQNSDESGVVDVGARVEGDACTIWVEDDGPGIPPEWRQRVFEKFAQVEREARQYGCGLGLVLCRLAVEAHGGQIAVSSEPGKGARFSVRIPMSKG